MDDRQQRIQSYRQKIISKRPDMISEEPRFFICNHCHNLVIQEKSSSNQTLFQCCGQTMNNLSPHSTDEDGKENIPILKFTGGISVQHAAVVEIGEIHPHPMTRKHHIEWVYLRTAQGGQLKYLTLNQYPQITFALSDEDAYAYCNRSVCKDCVFHCKRGFAAYAYCNKDGLWKVQY
ncbi:MAG: desulfoferrodoxin family protein [Sporolactobacillus sp.]